MTTEQSTVDVHTLSSWLEQKKPVTILDIRPESERAEWSIPGSTHVDAYVRLKANDSTALDEIMLDRSIPVVTVCAAGKTSLKAAELLRLQGYEVYSLEGGMKAWNFAWNSAEMLLKNVKVVQVRRSSKGCLSYVIGSGSEAIVIDAALDPSVYTNLAHQNGWTIKYVTDTHIHADYVSRTRELAMISGARHVLISNADVNYPFIPVRTGEYLVIGDAALKVIHTPGHTLESTSFQLGDEAVFTGDTLFIDGVGRPDLKADEAAAIERSQLLYKSLQGLLRLNAETVVLPAHLATAVPFDGKMIGETIGNLCKKLELLALPQKEFTRLTLSRIPPTPPNYLTIALLNKKGSYDGYSTADLEAGANRCAVA